MVAPVEEAEGMSGEAPGDLEMLRAFVNTYEADSGRDAIADPEALRAWLAGRGLLDPSAAVDGTGMRRAQHWREALRRLGLANHDGLPDAVAAGELDDLVRQCGLVVRVGEDGAVRLDAAGTGLDAALGRLAAAFYRATVDGTWARFKVCGNDTCRWAFYDHSRNHSGRFCGTACGNAVSARAYRRRRAAASAPD